MNRSDAALAAATSGRIDSDGPEATLAIGRALGAAARPGAILALIGPLGAGKTQLAKGVAVGLGVRGIVNSPTFVLINEHVGRLRMHHADAYRLDDPADAVSAGFLDDRTADGVVVVEWADRLAGWLPDERLEIVLGLTGDALARTLEWRATGKIHVRLATEALAAR